MTMSLHGKGKYHQGFVDPDLKTLSIDWGFAMEYFLHANKDFLSPLRLNK